MTINSQKTTATAFAYDGCHKIYLLDGDEWQDARDAGYSILPIKKLIETFEDSCELRFISDWALTKQYVRQFEPANFHRRTA